MQKWLLGDDPFYLKFWVKVTTLWQNRTSLHSHSLGGVTIDCLCCQLCHSGWRQTYNVSKILSPSSSLPLSVKSNVPCSAVSLIHYHNLGVTCNRNKNISFFRVYTLCVFLTVQLPKIIAKSSNKLQCIPGKKRPKSFSVISSTKLGQYWRNLVDSFVNKFAAKSYKRFPPHLNNVSILHWLIVKYKMFLVHMLPLSC